MPEDSSCNRPEPWISFDMIQLRKKIKEKEENTEEN